MLTWFSLSVNETQIIVLKHWDYRFFYQIRYILMSETIGSPGGKMGYLPLAINYRQIEPKQTAMMQSTHKV